MNKNKYIGHESQVCGVEEHQLIGGKGNGMRLLQVKNGKGLEFTVSADRCADISRFSFQGMNMGFFSANGYVSPSYYDDVEAGFLKSFTAGFLTTCGLTAVGRSCEDEGERLPLHGTISNIPAERIYWDMDENEIKIKARMNDAGIFSRKLTLDREITCSLLNNRIVIQDTIHNFGDTASPLMFLYHMNIGYPLLSEKAEVIIPSKRVLPRDERAAEGVGEWMKMTAPQAGFAEQCYFHEFEQQGMAAIFDPTRELGLKITFDAANLDFFTEWKMMGEHDYVLGLEPGNCNPNGRDEMRKNGKLKYIQPDEDITYTVQIDVVEGREHWKQLV